MVKQIHLLFRKLLKSKSVNGKDLSEEELYDLEESDKRAEDEINRFTDSKNTIKDKNNNSKIYNDESTIINLNKSINNKKENMDENKYFSDDNKGNKEKFENLEKDFKINSIEGFKSEEQFAMVSIQLLYFYCFCIVINSIFDIDIFMVTFDII